MGPAQLRVRLRVGAAFAPGGPGFLSAESPVKAVSPERGHQAWQPSRPTSARGWTASSGLLPPTGPGGAAGSLSRIGILAEGTTHYRAAGGVLQGVGRPPRAAPGVGVPDVWVIGDLPASVSGPEADPESQGEQGDGGGDSAHAQGNGVDCASTEMDPVSG